MKPVLVGIGGVCGALCRWWLGSLLQGRQAGVFPWPTFLINVSGCFVLGLVMSILATRVPADLREPLQLALGVGFLGAYTTFSTFAFEATALLQSGAWHLAIWYIGGSVLLGMLAISAGIFLGR